MFPQADIHNIAAHGANNRFIFQETVRCMRTTKYDTIVVAWTAIPRFRFNLGLELYHTASLLEERSIDLVAGQHIDADQLLKFGNFLRRYHNDHWDILELVQFVNILLDLKKTHAQGNVWFVNALVPWCQNYFDVLTVNKPSEFDEYLQKILQADLRDDTETLALYQKIINDYHDHGGIQPMHWLNLYQSLDSLKVDTCYAGDYHPGLRSQQVFAEFLGKSLKTKQQ